MIDSPLRGRNLQSIVYMLLFDAVVIWALFSWQYLDMLISGERRTGDPLVNAVLVMIAALLGLGMTLRIPHTWKDAIVFLRTKNAFPAHRAFSEMASNDPRYRPEVLQRKIDPFPKDPTEQQDRWLGLYRKHEGLAMVAQLHRQYMLCYEIAALSLLLIVPVLVLAAIRWSSQEFVLMGPLFLLGQYMMFMVATRFMSDDFVRGVLFIEAASG
jgi:hypothetical protein